MLVNSHENNAKKMVDCDGLDYGLQLMRSLKWSVLCTVTSPCGCEPSASHIEGDPICVRPGMKPMWTVWVIWWICRTWLNEDRLKQLQTDLRPKQCYILKLTNKRVSFWYIQDVIISVNRCNTKCFMFMIMNT